MKQFLLTRAKSFVYAFQGIWLLIKEQPNFRIHLVAFVSVTTLCYFCDISSSQWIAVILTAAVVVATEALNSSIEYLCDAVTEEEHPLIKKAKDAAAAAVLCVALAAIFVGYIPELSDCFPVRYKKK